MASFALLAPYIADGESAINDVREVEPREVYGILQDYGADLSINPQRPHCPGDDFRARRDLIGIEPPAFGQQASELRVDWRSISLTEWAAWVYGHYAQAEIMALLDRLADWTVRSESFGDWIYR